MSHCWPDAWPAIRWRARLWSRPTPASWHGHLAGDRGAERRRGPGPRDVPACLSGVAGVSRPAKLSTWVCTVAHRVAIDHVRRRATAPTISGDVPDAGTGQTLIERLEDRRPTPEAAVEVNQMHRLVREQVAHLPEKYRVPLVYAAIDGLDYDTIAAMLDMPVGTVKTLAFVRNSRSGRARPSASAASGRRVVTCDACPRSPGGGRTVCDENDRGRGTYRRVRRMPGCAGRVRTSRRGPP